MKTTSRKRLLISSVAMLLVAMLALGTATFAWFTQSTTATANGINVKTIKSSELVISKLDKAWGTQVKYNFGYDAEGHNTGAQTLLPVSSADGKNWYTTTAEVKGSYAAKAGTVATKIDNKDGYYFVNQLNVKNNGEADVDNVKINFSLGTDTNAATRTGYYRIALVPVTDSDENTDKIIDPTGADFFATTAGEIPTLKNIYGANDTEGYQALTGTKVDTDKSIKVQPNSETSVNVGTLKGKDAELKDGEKNVVYYNLYVWFEGQDVDCKDGNAGATIPQITFTVTGDTVEQ